MIHHLTAIYSVTIHLYFVDAYLTLLTFNNKQFAFLSINLILNYATYCSQIAIIFFKPLIVGHSNATSSANSKHPIK